MFFCRMLVLSTSITAPTSLTVLNRAGLWPVLPSHTLLASLDFMLCFVRTYGSEEDSFQFSCISKSLWWAVKVVVEDYNGKPLVNLLPIFYNPLVKASTWFADVRSYWYFSLLFWPLGFLPCLLWRALKSTRHLPRTIVNRKQNLRLWSASKSTIKDAFCCTPIGTAVLT